MACTIAATDLIKSNVLCADVGAIVLKHLFRPDPETLPKPHEVYRNMRNVAIAVSTRLCDREKKKDWDDATKVAALHYYETLFGDPQFYTFQRRHLGRIVPVVGQPTMEAVCAQLCPFHPEHEFALHTSTTDLCRGECRMGKALYSPGEYFCFLHSTATVEQNLRIAAQFVRSTRLPAASTLKVIATAARKQEMLVRVILRRYTCQEAHAHIAEALKDRDLVYRLARDITLEVLAYHPTLKTEDGAMLTLMNQCASSLWGHTRRCCHIMARVAPSLRMDCNFIAEAVGRCPELYTYSAVSDPDYCLEVHERDNPVIAMAYLESKVPGAKLSAPCFANSTRLRGSMPFAKMLLGGHYDVPCNEPFELYTYFAEKIQAKFEIASMAFRLCKGRFRREQERRLLFSLHLTLYSDPGFICKHAIDKTAAAAWFHGVFRDVVLDRCQARKGFTPSERVWLRKWHPALLAEAEAEAEAEALAEALLLV